MTSECVWCETFELMRRCKSLPFATLTLLLAAIFFLPASQLQAGASNKNGNPYGNGTFFNGGTFSAVIRGQNLSGTMLVSAPPGGDVGSNSTSTNGGGGVATIIFEGQNYNANANANVDASSGQIAGNFYGGMELSGSGSNTVLLSTTNAPTPVLFTSNIVTPITSIIPATNVELGGTDQSNQITTSSVVTGILSTNSNAVVSYFTNYGFGTNYTTNWQTVFNYNTNVSNSYTYTTNYSTNYTTNPIVINGNTNGYTTNQTVSIVQIITNTTTTYTINVTTNSNPTITSYVYTNTNTTIIPTTNYSYSVSVTYYTNNIQYTNVIDIPYYITNISYQTAFGATTITNGYSITNISTTNYINLQQDATTKYNDAMQIVGYYQGPLNNSYPNQTFSGNGQITSTQLAFGTNGLPSMQTQNSSIVVQGILISSSMESFSTYSNAVPYATTVYGVTNLTTNSF